MSRAQASSQTIQTRLQNYELILSGQKKLVEKSVSVLKHIKNWRRERVYIFNMYIYFNI